MLLPNKPFVFMATATLILLFPMHVNAGFEWQPPLQKSMPEKAPIAVAPAPMKVETQINPTIQSETMTAVPRAPIISEALPPTQLSQPVPLTPRIPVESTAIEKLEDFSPQTSSNQKTGGLYIDPYPLQRNQASNVVAYKKLDQAISEKSGALNPVQLGGGMTTGISQKPMRISKQIPLVSRAKSIESISTSSLTPMMGDEPAPLPGYGLDTIEREPLRQYSQAVGFGKNLPLALAISQVIPSDFTHRFDGDISPSAMVDWEGGKPWNVVLNDMLRNENLTAEIDGNVVVIKPMQKI